MAYHPAFYGGRDGLPFIRGMHLPIACPFLFTAWPTFTFWAGEHGRLHLPPLFPRAPTSHASLNCATSPPRELPLTFDSAASTRTQHLHLKPGLYRAIMPPVAPLSLSFKRSIQRHATSPIISIIAVQRQQAGTTVALSGHMARLLLAAAAPQPLAAYSLVLPVYYYYIAYRHIVLPDNVP